jgi:hypothetical protein
MLTFTDTNEVVPPSLTLAQLQVMRLAPQVKFQYARMKAGEVRAVLVRAIINGQPFHVSMQFMGEPLHGMDLMALDDAVGLILPNPGGWTYENEIARKAWHESWAKSTFGRAMELKPLELDANGSSKAGRLLVGIGDVIPRPEWRLCVSADRMQA